MNELWKRLKAIFFGPPSVVVIDIFGPLINISRLPLFNDPNLDVKVVRYSNAEDLAKLLNRCSIVGTVAGNTVGSWTKDLVLQKIAEELSADMGSAKCLCPIVSGYLELLVSKGGIKVILRSTIENANAFKAAVALIEAPHVFGGLKWPFFRISDKTDEILYFSMLAKLKSENRELFVLDDKMDLTDRELRFFNRKSHLCTRSWFDGFPKPSGFCRTRESKELRSLVEPLRSFWRRIKRLEVGISIGAIIVLALLPTFLNIYSSSLGKEHPILVQLDTTETNWIGSEFYYSSNVGTNIDSNALAMKFVRLDGVLDGRHILRLKDNSGKWTAFGVEAGGCWWSLFRAFFGHVQTISLSDCPRVPDLTGLRPVPTTNNPPPSQTKMNTPSFQTNSPAGIRDLAMPKTLSSRKVKQ